MKTNSNQLTIEDLILAPHLYGLPTFEEFQRNPDRWKTRKDSTITKLTEGPEQFRKDLKKIRFFVNDLEVTEDGVEGALADWGFSLEDIDVTNKYARLRHTIKMVPIAGGLAHEHHIHFFAKESEELSRIEVERAVQSLNESNGVA